ncbi:MazG-like family protein [Amphibacillus cookii]|uniref:MazG-like family protein n=1 Tax=Amphibacillus cookii TaxID=767787 RepID=UPI00195D1005|nr:MazG-like family protein [Amphibacillus cookii]MBM7542674.1 NTP pyrophosphatase (non-canonical NTP hydrolase) [Amphibacillus cookii]
MEQLIQDIKQMSAHEKKTLEQMGLKLSEEVGETNQAILSYLKASGNAYKQLGLDDVKEECVDVMLIALALYFRLSESDDELKALIRKKLKKWQEKVN